jgi:hypothetical protein
LAIFIIGTGIPVNKLKIKEPFPFCLLSLLTQHTNIKETGTGTTEKQKNQSRMLRAMEENLQTGNLEGGAPQQVHAMSGESKNKLVCRILFKSL